MCLSHLTFNKYHWRLYAGSFQLSEALKMSHVMIHCYKSQCLFVNNKKHTSVVSYNHYNKKAFCIKLSVDSQSRRAKRRQWRHKPITPLPFLSWNALYVYNRLYIKLIPPCKYLFEEKKIGCRWFNLCIHHVITSDICKHTTYWQRKQNKKFRKNKSIAESEINSKTPYEVTSLTFYLTFCSNLILIDSFSF